MNRSPRLTLPRTLSFVVVAAATLAGSWLACDGSSSSTHGTSGGGSTASAGGQTSTSTSSDDQAFCLPGPDAGPHQKCPQMLDAGEKCPPGCEIEVV